MIVLSGHVTFDHLHGGIKSGISVLFNCLMKSLRARKRYTLCDSFLIIIFFDTFWSFGVADFAFSICFSRACATSYRFCTELVHLFGVFRFFESFVHHVDSPRNLCSLSRKENRLVHLESSGLSRSFIT